MCKKIFRPLSFAYFLTIIMATNTFAYNIAGFISQGFTLTSENNFYTDTKDGSFQFNELGVNINSRISPVMTAGVQIISYTIGELGKNELAVDWGYADMTLNPYLGFKAGILKVPVGFYNEIRDIDMSLLYIYLPSSVYAIRERDTSLRLSGLGIYGEFPIFFFGDIGYQIVGGRPDMDETKGSSKIFEDINPSWEISDVDIDTTYTVDIKWHPPLPGLLIGFTYQYSSLQMTVDISNTATSILVDISKTDIFTFSTRYEWKNLMLEYEIYNRIAAISIPGLLTKDETTSRGWYTSAKYIFTDHIQAGLYYSEYYEDIDNRKGTKSDLYNPDSMAWQEEICLSVRFDITDTWIFKLEHHWMNGTSKLFRMDHIDINGNVKMEENWRLFAAKLSYTF